jgi:hypothetical protein
MKNFGIVGVLCALQQEAESAEGTTGSGGAKKPSGFAALLKSINKTGSTVKTGAKGKEVVSASESMIMAEIPELIGGLWDKGENGERIPKIAKNTGRASVIWTPRLGVNKGNVYVHRCGVLITPALAKAIIDHFGKHNRNQTKPAIKRYADDMSAGNWPYVGNTFGFVCAKKGDGVAFGQCNGGHTCKAVIESGVAVEVDIYFGVPEVNANLADVNIQRTGKDIVGRVHRYDKYAGLSEIDGEPIGFAISEKLDADVKAMSDIHSQAVRIVACQLAGKPVKDSEPLGPSAIAALDATYGAQLEQCVLSVYVLDKSATWENDKGNKVAGGLKRLMSLSHAAALLAVASITGDIVRDEKTGVVKSVKNLAMDDEVRLTMLQYFAAMVNYEDETDESNPAVACRNTLIRFKNNSVTNQNIRWLIEKYCAVCFAMQQLKASGVEGTEELHVPDYDSDTLFAVLVKSAKLADYTLYFETALDRPLPEKETAEPAPAANSGVSEIDDDEEMPSAVV